MKQKLFYFGFILTMIIIACSKKTVATKDSGVVSTTPATSTGMTSDGAPTESLRGNSETAVADVNLMAAGKTVYETKCVRCHAMKPVTGYTEPRWDAILKVMAPKAKLSEMETQQVAAYVKANARR